MKDKRLHYIDGAWGPSSGNQTVEVLNPSTGRPIAAIALGNAQDVERAVSAATKAFDVWRSLDVSDRIAYVEKIRAIYLRRASEMAETLSSEMGAPIDFARDAQVPAGTWHIDGFLDAIADFPLEHPLHPGSFETIVLDPVGVCGLITPWNWPMNQIVLKVIPALLVGCTVVLKPSEVTPLSAMLFAECLDEAGLPAGVFNLVNGDGPGAGSALTAHKDVKMVSFTGSTRAGIAIGQACMQTMTRSTLELGGKSPNLIFADSDLETAVRAGVQLCMENTGQSCNAPTRMLVEQSVYAQAVEVAAKAAQEIIVAAADQAGDHIGPLASQAQFDTVQRYIQVGQDEGARLVAGGLGKPDGLTLGYFARPTVFADVTPDMAIAREEIFGPVLVMIPFADEAEAIRLANDTPYGLAAYLSTGDETRADRVARHLRAGMISINQAAFDQGSPFGGFGLSGIGREGGKFGLEDFVETKTIAK